MPDRCTRTSTRYASKPLCPKRTAVVDTMLGRKTDFRNQQMTETEQHRPRRFAFVQLVAAGLWTLLGPAISAEPVEVSDLETHADWPSAAFTAKGDLWVAWTAYDNQGADRIVARRRSEGEWEPAMTVSQRDGDVLKTALAVQPSGRVWIAWAAQLHGNFDLYARNWLDGRWSAVQRLTSDRQPDIHHRLLADATGRLFLVWQSFRTGDANIYMKIYEEDQWSAAIPVTSHEANDWEPDAALDAQGRLFIVYDTYRHGNYDVFLRVFESGELSPEHPVADSGNFEARASVAVDGEGRAWVAWDDQGPGWALDMPLWTRAGKSADWGEPAPWSVEGSVGQRVSLRYSQRIGVAVFSGGQRWSPVGSLEEAMDEDFRLSYEIPQMTVDPGGTPRLFFRRWVPRNDGGSMKERPAAWNIHSMKYEGDRWTAPERVPGSAGSNDQRLARAVDPDGQVWIAYPADDRWMPGGPVAAQEARPNGRVRIDRVESRPDGRAELRPAPAAAAGRPYKATAWPDRRHRIAAGQKRYELYWGDLHRHTEISGDGGFDGTLWDMYRYALDAAELDFIASTDHFYGADGGTAAPEYRGYDWWRTQKLADAFHVRGGFFPLFGYERSLRWPYGHRNIINLERGSAAFNRTLARDLENEDFPREPDELRLWDHLRDQDAISIPHTIAAGGGTNFAFNDPALEPLLEIYQGCRLSYEADGAPRVRSGERFADGLAWSALAKGYRIGFIASSDHRSTHVSYAAVYAEEPTREGIFRALQQRHAYAATDNIVLDVRVGEAIMGDAIRLKEVPQVHVAVRGTGPIHEVQIIKDSSHVYSVRPGTREASFAYRDADASPGESYYYVRVQQEDGQLAWASPIWIEYDPE